MYNYVLLEHKLIYTTSHKSKQLTEIIMIEDVYMELKRLGAVKSSNEFSKYWLGMEKSYLRTMKAKHRKPSARVLAYIAVKLKEDGERLEKNSNPKIASAGHYFRQMSDRCINEILKG